MTGLVILGAGMLVAPDSNLLGGLARLLPGGQSTPRSDEVAESTGGDEGGDGAGAHRQP